MKGFDSSWKLDESSNSNRSGIFIYRFRKFKFCERNWIMDQCIMFEIRIWGIRNSLFQKKLQDELK